MPVSVFNRGKNVEIKEQISVKDGEDLYLSIFGIWPIFGFVAESYVPVSHGSTLRHIKIQNGRN